MSRPTPPTYDLRELGSGLDIYRRLERLADEVLELAERHVGAAFTRVPAYAARAAAESGRDDEHFRRTTRERYLAELVAFVVMSRQLWPLFVARRHTVLLLPDCLALRQSRCSSTRTRYGRRCTSCEPRCQIAKITALAQSHGAAAYFADLGHEKQLKALKRGRYKDLSVLGIACLWMLVNGMRAAEQADVPSQGVLLDYCGCEHWVDRPFVTRTAVDRVREILEAKHGQPSAIQGDHG